MEEKLLAVGQRIPSFKLNPAKDLSRKDLDALSVIVCNDISDQESLWSDLVAVV